MPLEQPPDMCSEIVKLFQTVSIEEQSDALPPLPPISLASLQIHPFVPYMSSQ